MVEYELVVDYSTCTGCRLCETACSLRGSSEINPQKSKIRIVKLEGEADLTCIPVRCMQCEDPPCEAVCPSNAISTNATTGARLIDKDRCIGCSSCVYVCPFGAITLDRSQGSTFVCDLCDGDPLCVRLCPFEALQYIRSDEISIQLKRSRAGKLLEFFQSTSTSTPESATPA